MSRRFYKELAASQRRSERRDVNWKQMERLSATYRQGEDWYRDDHDLLQATLIDLADAVSPKRFREAIDWSIRMWFCQRLDAAFRVMSHDLIRSMRSKVVSA